MEEGQKAEVDAKGGLKIEPTEEDQPEAVGCEGVQSLSDIQVPKTGQLCELDSKNVECDLCQEEVEEGDKYRLHLVDKHNVTMEEVEAMADAAMSS